MRVRTRRFDELRSGGQTRNDSSDDVWGQFCFLTHHRRAYKHSRMPNADRLRLVLLTSLGVHGSCAGDDKVSAPAAVSSAPDKTPAVKDDSSLATACAKEAPDPWHHRYVKGTSPYGTMSGLGENPKCRVEFAASKVVRITAN